MPVIIVGISALAFTVTVLHTHNFLLSYKIGMLSRIIMTAAIYQKVLSLSQVIVGQISIGHIVNLASNDVQRFDLVWTDPVVLMEVDSAMWPWNVWMMKFPLVCKLSGSLYTYIPFIERLLCSNLAITVS